MHKNFVLIIWSFVATIQVFAQNTLCIHNTDGSLYEIPIKSVDSITFVNTDTLSIVETELEGSWFWGNVEQGYYELLTFNEDKTYTGYDNYFTYGFDTMTYGFYSQYGTMLTLWSNGFGYNRRYNWYIMGLSENALEVMTKMGPFTYYKLQQEVIHLRVNEPIVCEEGDSFVFVDGAVAKIEDGKLVGILPGTTYVEKLISATNMIYAYKVIVE